MTRRNQTILALLVLGLAACASTESYSYKLYPGPERPVEELATVELAGVDFVVIDGLQVNRADYARALLLPGKHRVAINKTFGFSVMVEPSMMGSFESSLEVPLAAGKVYRIKGDRTHGHDYRIYLWVEEEDSGEVVAGQNKP